MYYGVEQDKVYTASHEKLGSGGWREREMSETTFIAAELGKGP